jgi:hypothetical protein
MRLRGHAELRRDKGNVIERKCEMNINEPRVIFPMSDLEA